MDRKERRARTYRHCVRAKKLWVSHRLFPWDPESYRSETISWPLGRFRKNTGAGCRGSKKGSSSSSKLGSCCKGGYDLRKTVKMRHEFRLLCQLWKDWVQLNHPDDFID